MRLMRHPSRTWLLIALILALALSACGDSSKDDNDKDSSGTDADGSGAAALELEVTNLFDSGLSFLTPDGWVVTSSAPYTTVANSDAALAASSPESGMVAMIIIEPAGVLLARQGESFTNREILPTIAGSSSGEQVEVSDVTELTINGNTAYRVDITRSEAEGFALIIELSEPDRPVAMIALTARGELDDFEPTLLAVAETIDFTG